MRELPRSERLFTEASQVIPGGVSSDARRVPGTPLYVDYGRDAHLWDVDGNRYVDFVLGQGPAILGHSPARVVEAIRSQAGRGLVYSAQHEAEVEVAQRICRMVHGVDQVRFNTVGSEAVHAALRVARGYTRRSKIMKFEGHYHGWFDPVLYSVHPDPSAFGPEATPAVVPGTHGQQLSSAPDLLVLPWNDAEAVERAFTEHAGEIAAVITEPVMCNSGAISPDPGFLRALIDIAHSHGALVVFDEIITGFRLAPGGASEYFDVRPDLITFGKAIAGGMPLSALCGTAEVMSVIANSEVAHAGTFNSHPVAIAAAQTTLSILDEERGPVFTALNDVGQSLMEGMRKVAASVGVPMLVDGPGPVFQTYFTEATTVRTYRDFAATDRQKNVRMQELLANRGVNVNTRGLWFVSSAHTSEDIDETLAAFEDALRNLL